MVSTSPTSPPAKSTTFLCRLSFVQQSGSSFGFPTDRKSSSRTIRRAAFQRFGSLLSLETLPARSGPPRAPPRSRPWATKSLVCPVIITRFGFRRLTVRTTTSLWKTTTSHTPRLRGLPRASVYRISQSQSLRLFSAPSILPTVCPASIITLFRRTNCRQQPVPLKHRMVA